MVIACVLRATGRFYLKLYRLQTPAFFFITNPFLPHPGHEKWQVLHIISFNVMTPPTTVLYVLCMVAEPDLGVLVGSKYAFKKKVGSCLIKILNPSKIDSINLSIIMTFFCRFFSVNIWGEVYVLLRDMQ